MQIGLNADETFLTGYGTQHIFCNQFRSSRGHRTFRGARVSASGHPEWTDPADPLSRISYTMSHWLGGLPEPYHGDFVLLMDGDAEVTIQRKGRNGSTIDQPFRQRVQGPAQLPVSLPPLGLASCIHVTFRMVRKPVTAVALVHIDHLTAHESGQHFNPDYMALQQQLGGVWRTMKLTRSDDDPLGVTVARVGDLDWTGTHPDNRRGVPYKAVIDDAKAYGITPWINLNAAITDAEIDQFADDLKSAGIVAYVGYGNEVFHGPAGGSPHHYWIDQAKAKWGTGSSARHGRQYLAWRFAYIIARLERAGVRHLCKIVYEDQGNWAGWVSQVFDSPLWIQSATADHEEALIARWRDGSMIDVFAFNAYFGERLLPKFKADGTIKKPGFIDWAEKDDPARVLWGLGQGANLRTSQIASVKSAIQAQLPGRAFEWAAYEGGLSDSSNHISYFQSLPEMEAAQEHWLSRCDTVAGLDLVMHYADLTPGPWRLFPHVRSTLDATPKTKALLPFRGSGATDSSATPSKPAPGFSPSPGPVSPPPPIDPVDDPQPPLPPVDDAQKPPGRTVAAIVADMRALLDELEQQHQQ